MIVFYFGADDTWSNLIKIPFRRRNTLILKSLVDSTSVSRVFVVRKTTRWQFLKNLLSFEKKSFEKVQDVFFVNLFPGFLHFESLNQSIARLFIFFQVKIYFKEIYLWAYWPNGYKILLDSGLKGFKVFDTDHNIIDDPNLDYQYRLQREKDLLYYGNDADIILSSVRSMMEWYQKKNILNLYRYRNGIKKELLSTFPLNRDSKEIILGYCGTLSRWIDFDLMFLLMSRNPSWKLVILGKPYLNEDWMKLKALKNVNFLGEKNSDEAMGIIRNFNIGLNLYKHHPALDVDSMKLYDYLAAGIPVVSTHFHTYLSEDFNELIYTINNIDELENSISTILYNKETSSNTFTYEFLKNSTWDCRLKDFLSHINKINGRAI